MWIDCIFNPGFQQFIMAARVSQLHKNKNNYNYRKPTIITRTNEYQNRNTITNQPPIHHVF